MGILEQAFFLVFDPYVLTVILLSGIFGLFVGALPGLTATMATALLVPITFFMDPVPAIAAIVTTTTMAIFAGDIPGALLRIPGTPASAAYVDDAYLMSRNGQAERALGTSLCAAVIGGLFGALVLSTSAPLLAEVALRFSSFEYFWLAVFGLSCAAFVSTGSPLKGMVSLFLGLFVATIGIDPTAGHPRYTFGSVELLAGISFIPAMIGMFAISELIRTVTHRMRERELPQVTLSNPLRGMWGVLRRYKLNVGRGSVIGVTVGALPGAGADIAAWIAYATSKRFSKDRDKYGTGHVEGLVDAGAANNAGIGGAWVPAIVFGIPGDTITAIVVGVLYMKGMNPGPTVFMNEPQLIYAVFLTFFVATLLMLPLGVVAIRLAKQVLKVPRDVLVPIILLFCIVGAFAINNTVIGVVMILVLGIIAFLMEDNGFPLAPAILGIVLGPMLERTFMTSMMRAQGDLTAFFDRPIAAALGYLTILVWTLVFLGWIRRSLRARA